MLEFKPIEINDGEYLIPILRSEPDRGCEYTFGNLFIWAPVYKTEAARGENGVYIRFGSMNRYLFPVGAPDVKRAMDELLEHCSETGESLRFIALSASDKAALERLYPDRFSFKRDETYAEYVYNSSDLIELKGKKYHGKRNHIARFERANPSYSFTIISPDNIDRVRAMNDEWCRVYGCSADSGLKAEHCAVERAFEHYFSLPFDGGFVETDGRIVAYAIGEAINDETYCVHIEKAFHDVEGAYAIINRDFARELCSDYSLINREDAAGEEGLIKAKLSYYPAVITEKYSATER